MQQDIPYTKMGREQLTVQSGCMFSFEAVSIITKVPLCKTFKKQFVVSQMSDFAIAIACNRAEQGGPSLPLEIADYPQEKETSFLL